jgi:phage-related protein
MARQPKPIVFQATSLDDLRAFPASARRMAGFQLDRVQHGEEPNDWKPMRSVGPGVREISEEVAAHQQGGRRPGLASLQAAG